MMGHSDPKEKGYVTSLSIDTSEIVNSVVLCGITCIAASAAASAAAAPLLVATITT